MSPNLRARLCTHTHVHVPCPPTLGSLTLTLPRPVLRRLQVPLQGSASWLSDRGSSLARVHVLWFWDGNCIDRKAPGPV